MRAILAFLMPGATGRNDAVWLHEDGTQMRASEPGRFGLASCHASSMVISLAKRVFSVDFGGALPAVIRSRTWPTRPRALTWS